MSGERIALLGYGAIARTLATALPSGRRPLHVGAVLTRTGGPVGAAGTEVFSRLEDLIAWRPTIVAECAGHDAVRELAPSLLTAGVDVVVASVGALCDGQTRARLNDACAAGRSRLIVATGAVGGLDALAAARLGGLDSVLYIARKPPHAWSGQAGVAQASPRSCEPAVVFEGSAGEAARRFPQNANVAAAIALAGLGFAATKVCLLADPAVSRNVHEIRASGTFGELWIQIANEPLAQNPKTSQLAALSVEKAIRERLGQATWP